MQNVTDIYTSYIGSILKPTTTGSSWVENKIGNVGNGNVGNGMDERPLASDVGRGGRSEVSDVDVKTLRQNKVAE